MSAAAVSEVDLIDNEPARRVKLLPMGAITMRDGRGPYRVRDLAHAQEIVAATQAFFGSADMPADRDHQMAFAVKPGVGGTGKATGWVKTANITAEPDGIYANDIEWTPAAHAELVAREYRYVSPLFMATAPKDGGDVLQLKNFALVNIGAIDLPAIAAALELSRQPGDEDTMDLTAIAALLGLGADATAEQVAAAIGDLKNAKPATSSIAVAAGLAETAGIEEIAAAVTTLKSGTVDPAKFVPIAAFNDLNTRLSVLDGDRAEQVVAAAMSPEVRKITPAMKEWALDYFKKDEPGFRAWLENAPQAVAAATDLDGRKPGTKRTTLTADEIAACEMTGMSHEDFLAAENAKIGEVA